MFITFALLPAGSDRKSPEQSPTLALFVLNIDDGKLVTAQVLLEEEATTSGYAPYSRMTT